MNAEPLVISRLKSLLDIGLRIEELKLLKNGWLNGKGLAPVHDGLDRLALAFDKNYPADALPLPHLYSTPEGRVRAEWSLHPNEISLEIDVRSQKGSWHNLDLENDAEDTQEVDLNQETGWEWLVSQIRQHSEMNG